MAWAELVTISSFGLSQSIHPIPTSKGNSVLKAYRNDTPYILCMYAGENSVQQGGREEAEENKLEVLSSQETRSDDVTYVHNKLQRNL